MDYEAIISQLDDDKIIQLMTRLGADRYINKPNCIIFPTICHNESAADASMKLYFYKNNKIFNCYSCDGIMSIFKFLKTYYENRHIEYDWYNDIYQVILDCSNFNPDNGFISPKTELIGEKFGKRAEPLALPTYNAGVLDCFVKKYPIEWLNDGISKSAMDKFDIRFSISQNKIIIPHKDVKGNLIGIRGRALNEWDIENLGKYMPVQIENVWYKHPLSLNLYGLYENKENIKRTKVAYLFESEKSVLQFENFNRINCATAVCGSNFNKFQLRLLMEECAPSEIVVCFDREELVGEEKYYTKLLNICEKYKNYAHFSFIYDRSGLTKLKDSPSDDGEEIFNELLKTRVHINQ